MAQFQILTHLRHLYNNNTVSFEPQETKSEEAPLLTNRIKHSDTQAGTTGHISKSVNSIIILKVNY